MSVSALTTAMAVAAAAVPNGNAPDPALSSDVETVAIDLDPPEVEAAEGSEGSLPPVLALSAAPPESDDPALATDPVQASDPTQSIDSTSSEQPGSPAAATPNEQSQIVVTGRRASPDDPLEQLNGKSFNVTQSVDRSIIAPVAFAYKDVMPRPLRKGLSNFLRNLGEPIVFLNFMLQLKPGKAAETLGRFAINTTLGAGGVVDVAKRKPFNLPHRDNGFANTLGYYGVKPGPYFFLPLVGPTTLRDFIGGRLDLLFLPLVIPRFDKRAIFAPLWVLSELNRRIESDDEISKMRATNDPYVTTRTQYLQKRQADIDALHGRGAGTTKPPVPAPPSTRPAPAPISPSPIHYPPRSDSTWTLGGSQTLALTENLLRGSSLVGLGAPTLLSADFNRATILSLGQAAGELIAPKILAYTR